MFLVLKKDKFEIENIIFKYKKNLIKINYKLENICLLGLLFSIRDFNIIKNDDNFYLIKLSENDTNFFENIDQLFSEKINNYRSFINNRIIKVKDYNDSKINEKECIRLNISSIKERKYEKYYTPYIYVI